MKLALVLTNDWELYGNGSGDYFDIQHKPLSDFLEMADDYGASVTLFAEIMQQIKHKELISEHSHFAEICNAWDEIVLRNIQSGGDVQLHIHSQWLDARYDGSHWHLNMQRTAIGQLEHNSIDYLVDTGKKYLEKTIQAHFEDYSCRAFRAGAYCIEPSRNVIPILKKHGIKADSSVTKGLKNDGFFDYTNAYSHYEAWKTSADDIKTKSDTNDGLIELPIFSIFDYDSQVLRKFFPKLYYKSKFSANVATDEINWLKEKEQTKEKRYPRSERYYKANQKNLGFYLSALFSKSTTQLDYDFLPASAFVKIIENFHKKMAKNPENHNKIIPIIASGHFKDIHNLNNLKKIFKLLDKKLPNMIEYWTVSRLIDLIGNKIKGLRNEL